MKNAVILHGTDFKKTHSESQNNWFPWLETELKDKGYKVWLPELPDADRPSVCTYNPFLDEGWNYDLDTVLVGHSSGAVAIINLLNKMQEGFKINKAILVGSFRDDLDMEGLSGLFTYEWDFDKIKSKVNEFVFIHSDNDPYCPLEHATYLSGKLGGKLVIMKGQKHFSIGTAGEKYKKFPELLKYF